MPTPRCTLGPTALCTSVGRGSRCRCRTTPSPSSPTAQPGPTSWCAPGHCLCAASATSARTLLRHLAQPQMGMFACFLAPAAHCHVSSSPASPHQQLHARSCPWSCGCSPHPQRQACASQCKPCCAGGWGGGLVPHRGWHCGEEPGLLPAPVPGWRPCHWQGAQCGGRLHSFRWGLHLTWGSSERGDRAQRQIIRSFNVCSQAAGHGSR